MIQLKERVVTVYRSGDGYRLRTGGGTDVECPAGVMWDPTFILDLVAPMFDDAGTLVLPHRWLSGDRAWSDLARAAGWAAFTIEDSPWVTFRQHGKPTIYACHADKAEGDYRNPLMPKGIPAQDRGRLFDLWHTLTGTPFRGSPGVVGVELLRRSLVKRQPQWLDRAIEVDGLELRGQGDIIWESNRVPWHVFEWDLNSQYLAACTTLMAPWQGLGPRDTSVFDAKQAGFWHVRTDDMPGWVWGSRGAPPVLERRVLLDDNTMWISTPIMEYLAKAGVKPEVIRAMVSQKSGTWLAPWAKTMYELRTFASQVFGNGADGELLAGTVKRAANETIGLMARRGGRCYNPALRWLIIDQARANLLRKIDRVVERTGHRPVRVNIDAVYYSAYPDDQPATLAETLGVPISDKLGGFKFAHRHFMNSWRANANG